LKLNYKFAGCTEVSASVLYLFPEWNECLYQRLPRCSPFLYTEEAFSGSAWQIRIAVLSAQWD